MAEIYWVYIQYSDVNADVNNQNINISYIMINIHRKVDQIYESEYYR